MNIEVCLGSAVPTGLEAMIQFVASMIAAEVLAEETNSQKGNDDGNKEEAIHAANPV